MDELKSLRGFRREVVPEEAARADARRALLAAVEGRRRGRRSLAVAAIAGAVLVIAGAAYALGVRFLAGDPAPQAVKDEARLLNEVKGELIPRARTGPRVLADETRAAAVLDASTGPVYLWIAPTETGGSCHFLHVVGTEQPDGRPNLSGGCGRFRTPLDSMLRGTRLRSGSWLVLVYGRVERPVARVEVAVEGGPRLVPPVAAGGYFLAEIPGVGDSRVPTLEVIGLAADGRVVARERRGRPEGLPTRPVDPAGETPVLEILTRRTRKPIRLYAFERDGERCTVLETPGGTGSGCGQAARRPREIAVFPNQIGSAPKGMLLLWGDVGADVARLELRFEDGRVERLPLVRGWTLYQVAPADFAAGRRPVEVVGRDAAGEVVGRNGLGPWRAGP